MRLFMTLVLASFIAAPSAFSDNKEEKNWPSLQCSADNRQHARGFAAYWQAQVDAARDYLKNCRGGGGGAGGGQNAYNQCLSYLLDKGYRASDAKSYCTGMNRVEVGCFKSLVEKGYRASDAKANCVGQTQGSSLCFIGLVDKGYRASDAKTYCAGLNQSSGECVLFRASSPLN